MKSVASLITNFATLTGTTTQLSGVVDFLNSQSFMGLITTIPKLIVGLISLTAQFGFAEVKTLGLKGALDMLNINPVMLALSVLTAVIGGVVLATNNAKQKAEEARQKAQEAISTYSEAQNTLKENKQTISEISSEFEELSKGVGNNGQNISLTADEYSRYHEIANQIADMFPDLIKGYDDELLIPTVIIPHIGNNVNNGKKQIEN